MRIIAGRWRGRRLLAPRGVTTRPTAERLRQSLFDMLRHAPWCRLEDALVLDVFAGTGALGLEALSRGAARAEFFERDRQAVAALRANIAACGAEALTQVHDGDALHPGSGPPAGLVLLDPPYGAALAGAAIAALAASGRIGRECIIVVEVGRAETPPALGKVLAERVHGAGRLLIGLAAEKS
jgi:16S rRNA (guanine966-N2)-methyltransferase